MNSLLFLITRILKNYVLEVLRTPSKLILWGAATVGIGALIWLGSTNQPESPDEIVDIVWLKGAVFLMLLFFTVLAVTKGLQSGDSIFTMSDVNLLFVSPLNPRLILLYGVMRMATSAFWAGFFILFQGSTLGSMFGVQFSGLLLLLACFLLVVLTLQILTLTIYSLVNGRPERQRVVQILAIVALAPVLVVALVGALQTGDWFGAVENVLRSPVLTWTPVAGWGAQGAISLLEGNIGAGLFFLGLVVALAAALVTFITLSNPDYYEDVLVATETEFEKKRAAAEGQINTSTGGRKIKVVRTGIGGSGASTLFYKHVRESFRTNLLGLWGPVSILTVLGGVAFAYLLRDEGGAILILLQILMWMQLFMVGESRGLKELYSHYIYMIPAGSLTKIVWSNLEIVFKVLVESVLLFGLAGIITGANPLVVVMAILVYTFFTMMLIGINYLSMRWTSISVNSGILIFLYIVAVLVLIAPGLVGAIVLGVTIGGTTGAIAGLGVLALWELLVALGCFALSKGALDNSDISVVQT